MRSSVVHRECRPAALPAVRVARTGGLLAAVLLVATEPAAATGRSAPAATAASATVAEVGDSLRQVIERALVTADWTALEGATQRLRHATRTAAGQRDAWLHYDLAYALHRRASALIVEKRAPDARSMLEEAAAAAQTASALGAGAHATALEGAVTGQLVGVVGGLSVMRLGPRSFRLLDAAMAALPDDPRVALLNGISRLNAPRAFGGGPAKGETELRRALGLFERDPNQPPLPTWGRVDAHIWLAIALEQLDRPAEARAELQRALALAPGHRWITGELLPRLDAGR